MGLPKQEKEEKLCLIDICRQPLMAHIETLGGQDKQSKELQSLKMGKL